MIDSFFRACENLLGSTHIDTNTDTPVLIPPSEEQLCEILRLATKNNYKVHIAAGSTLPAPPLTDRTVSVSLTGLSGASDINASDFVIISQAGVIVDQAVEEAGNAGLLLPLDITSGAQATVGGAYMAGSLGLSSARYGAFRDSVIGVRCVTAEGKVVRFGGRTAKNVTGYDLTWFLGGTMGIFAIATELTVKVRPLPETRIVAVSRYTSHSKSFDTHLASLSGLHHISSLELVAAEGLSGEITIGAGIEGMEKLAVRSVQKCRTIMEAVEPHEYHEEAHGGSFRNFRREVSRRFVGPGFYSISLPSSASAAFLERLSAYSPDIPVIGHPLMGRFHVVCHDEVDINAITKTVLALGGKIPVEWSTGYDKAISGIFTGAELSVALSLKHELDPDGILNPHLSSV